LTRASRECNFFFLLGGKTQEKQDVGQSEGVDGEQRSLTFYRPAHTHTSQSKRQKSFSAKNRIVGQYECLHESSV
jgi:hypothetical protein